MASVDDEIIKFPFFCDTGKCQSCIACCRHNRMGLDILRILFCCNGLSPPENKEEDTD